FFFFSSRRRHTRSDRDWSSDVCSSDLGLQPTVDTYGPPPLAKMTHLIEEVNAVDIATRIADEGRPPFAGLVAAHEITAGGVVMQIGRASCRERGENVGGGGK